MSVITEQIKRLSEYAGSRKGEIAIICKDAAETIETLSEKVRTANMKRSTAYYNGGWIPVKERLPEKDTEYLITRDGSLGMSIVDIASWSNLEKHNNGFYKANMIIAWMPLPEPYREDGE